MRHIIAVGFLFALCGCSGMSDSLSDMFSFGHESAEDETPVATQAAAAPAPAAPDTFCQNVAVNDATSHGYDAETQKRVALQSYAQCHALFQR